MVIAAHAPFAMRARGATTEDYFRSYNPMQHRAGVAVPTLVINSEDDFVCSARNIQPQVIVDEQPGSLLLVTKRGSHGAFNEGLLGRGSYHVRLSLDFLDAARETAREDRAAEAAEGARRREEGEGREEGESATGSRAIGLVVQSKAAGRAPARALVIAHAAEQPAENEARG